MELKKKTIIWEDNNIPPKDYLWIKSDGKVYEFNHTTRQWQESKTLQTKNDSGSGSGSGSGTTTKASIDFSKIIFKSDLQEKLEALTFEDVYLEEYDVTDNQAHPNWTYEDVINDDCDLMKAVLETGSTYLTGGITIGDINVSNWDGIPQISYQSENYDYIIEFDQSNPLNVSYISRAEHSGSEYGPK